MTIRTAIQSHLSDVLIEMQHPQLQDQAELRLQFVKFLLNSEADMDDRFVDIQELFNECFELDFIDERYSQIYLYLLNIYTKFDSIVFTKTPGEELLIDLKSDLTNLTAFELFSAADISDDMRAELSAKFFVLSDIPGVKVLDHKFMEVMKFADEFTKDTKDLLPQVSFYNRPETHEQIKIYLKTLQVLEIPIPELN